MPKPIKTENGTELSLYSDEKPEEKDFEKAANRLSVAFPKMSKEFFVLLSEFVIKHEFTAKRLADAVNHVITNFQYKELNISDVIKFDRRVRLYTGTEYMDMQAKGIKSTEFEKRLINGKMYFVKKSDILNS